MLSFISLKYGKGCRRSATARTGVKNRRIIHLNWVDLSVSGKTCCTVRRLSHCEHKSGAVLLQRGTCAACQCLMQGLVRLTSSSLISPFCFTLNVLQISLVLQKTDWLCPPEICQGTWGFKVSIRSNLLDLSSSQVVADAGDVSWNEVIILPLKGCLVQTDSPRVVKISRHVMR